MKYMKEKNTNPLAGNSTNFLPNSLGLEKKVHHLYDQLCNGKIPSATPSLSLSSDLTLQNV